MYVVLENLLYAIGQDPDGDVLGKRESVSTSKYPGAAESSDASYKLSD